MTQKQITIVVALILNEKGEILLAKRNSPDLPEEHEKWEFVGGKIEFGETPEDALKREVNEESGLEIEVVRLLPKVYSQVWKNQNPLRQIIILSYECKIVRGRLAATDREIAELKFVKISDVPSYSTLPNVREIIELLNS